MSSKFSNLLGKTVLPIVKRRQYGAAECDRVGMLPYLNGEERRAYGIKVVDERVAEQKKDNKRMVWKVFAVRMDNTFDLRSDMGYEQCNVNRSDFRLINKKK
jgi:hypothetical protein